MSAPNWRPSRAAPPPLIMTALSMRALSALRKFGVPLHIGAGGRHMDSELHGRATEWRRHLHRHPELSLQEQVRPLRSCVTGCATWAFRSRPAWAAMASSRPEPGAIQPQRRPARRHGRAADHGDERRRLRVHQRRRHACLRARWPYCQPARRSRAAEPRHRVGPGRCASCSSPPKRATAVHGR